jgi:23S rRNA (guanosine2251-2'-O)-methyltransferase
MRKLTHEEIARSRLAPGELTREARFPIALLLDNIRSLYNVGSIFRTADAARVLKIHLCGYTPHPPRREIEKTALGATATVPWEHHTDPLAAVRALKADGMRICILEHTDESRPYTGVAVGEFPICLVVGNEINGVSKELIAEADMALEIPMFGMKQSLNAAVACGIALFELVRVLQGETGRAVTGRRSLRGSAGG